MLVGHENWVRSLAFCHVQDNDSGKQQLLLASASQDRWGGHPSPPHHASRARRATGMTHQAPGRHLGRWSGQRSLSGGLSCWLATELSLEDKAQGRKGELPSLIAWAGEGQEGCP